MTKVPGRCDRCGNETFSTIMSKFNTEMICLKCNQAEKKHPRYGEADQAEINEIKKGNMNFPGIGLPHDL